MDLVQLALVRAQQHDSLSLLLAFAAGGSSSLGPCVAPRYLAVASLSSHGAAHARIGRVLALVVGTLVTFAAIAVSGATVTRLIGASALLYWALGGIFAGYGVYAILKVPKSCGPKGAPKTYGGGFFLGIATSLVISPCCTPVLIALGGLAAADASAAGSLPLVASFTIGHLLPIGAVLAIGRGMDPLWQRSQEAAATVNGAVLIALGAYYAALA